MLRLAEASDCLMRKPTPSFRPSVSERRNPEVLCAYTGGGDFDAIDATHNNTLFRRFAPYDYARNDRLKGGVQNDNKSNVGVARQSYAKHICVL